MDIPWTFQEMYLNTDYQFYSPFSLMLKFSIMKYHTVFFAIRPAAICMFKYKTKFYKFSSTILYYIFKACTQLWN